MTARRPESHSLLEAALAFVYPEVCQICGEVRATQKEGFVCAACWRNVRFVRAPFCDRCGLPYEGEITGVFECSNCKEMKLHFSSARSAVAAQGVVLEVIHRFKYQRAVWFENFLADLLIREAAPVLRLNKWDWLVPVPLHPTKFREREFNQAERIARLLGEATGIVVNTQFLRRVLPTRTQTQLTRQQREDNMKNAFVVTDNVRLKGEKVVLIDDVLTTGATTSACAKALIAAGAGEVCVWTVARGL
jgi:competence protein ComFC